MSQSGTEPAAVDLPGYCLGHLHSRTYPLSMWHPGVSHYDLYPVEIPRPAHGRTTETIVCGTCGRGLSCTISSREQMRRDRRRMLAEGLALAAAGAGFVTGFFLLAAGKVLGVRWLIVPGVLMMPLAFGMVIMGGLLIGEVRSVPGARLESDEDHQLRSPGSTVSVQFPLSDPPGE